MKFKEENGAYILQLGSQFRDYECSAKLGIAKEALRRSNRPKKVVVDMQITEWADPLPLLSLGAILHTVGDYSVEVVVNLGSSVHSRPEHRIFLKFLATQGFLGAYGEFATFEIDKHFYSKFRSDDLPLEDLVHELSRYQQPTNFRNADCIFAKLIGVHKFHADPDHVLLDRKVEELVGEASNRLIDSAYGRVPLIRDRLLQKTRKLLFELIANAVEHAYPGEYQHERVKGYVGVYARMRAGLPNNQQDATAWRKLWVTERLLENCPCLSPFEANPLAPWIEIFICDAGAGLLANVQKWTAPNDLPNVIEVLKDLKRTARSHPLQSLSRILFTQPFSSIQDRSGARTSVTGLLHLGLMLQRDGDFSRIYSNGEWAGSGHPWNPAQTGAFADVVELQKGQLKESAPGTWFAFGIQPAQPAIDYPGDRWIVASPEDREHLIAALTQPSVRAVPVGVRFEDRRADPHCALPLNWSKYEDLDKEKIFESRPIVILRPPRSVQKRQIGIWIDRLSYAAQNVRALPSRPSFVVADLTPFQAITYAELVSRHVVRAHFGLDIYFVTEDWAVCCLTSGEVEGGTELLFDTAKANAFMKGDAYPLGKPIRSLNAATLLLILRLADSRIFWQPVDVDGETTNSLLAGMFIPGRVKWNSTRTLKGEQPGPGLYINGYLDLSRALVDSRRYRACHRALRRCLNLFSKYEVIASDDLVRSVAIDADRERHRLREDIENDSARPKLKLVVGSIRVTSSTVTRFLERADVPKGSREIYLFSHPDSDKHSRVRPVSVLDWLPPAGLGQKVGRKLEALEEYERIPETPYIGIGGEKGIVIPRFRNPLKGTKVLDQSLYERNPQQTYDDLHQLGALKLGHWIYGSKHDLLTINLGRAIELSALDNGPLYRWLSGRIEALCFSTGSGQTRQPSAVLIYPSHPITDQIISTLLGQAFQRNASTNGGNADKSLSDLAIVPIQFLSSNTISPLRAAPLAFEGLRKSVEKVQRLTGACRAVVLDDGTLSGKMFRELEQAVKSLGVKEVHSVALVDRGGLPIYLSYVETYVQQHHRFWRWDVPPLGSARGCPLCASLSRVSIMRDRTPTQSIRARLARWGEIWRPVQVIDNWDAYGLTPIPLGKDLNCDSHRFGIYVNDSEEASHRVTHQTSTGMVAAAMEISRATPRSYYALEKARKMVACYGSRVGIEMLSAQILLFIDELGYWDRIDRFRELIVLLCGSEEDSDATAMAGLCLTLVDDDLVPDLWLWFKKEVLCRDRVRLLDARITAEALRSRFNGLASMPQDHLSPNPSEQERYNYSVMFSDASFRHNIASVIEIVGASHREVHNMGLSACLKELSDASKGNDHPRSVRRLKNAKQILEDLQDTLRLLDPHLSRIYLEDELSPKADAEIVHQHILNAPVTAPGSEDRFLSDIPQWVATIEREILQEGNAASLARRYRAGLVRTTNPTIAKDLFLSELVMQVRDVEWSKIVQAKLDRGRPVCSRWVVEGEKKVSRLRPSIESGNNGTWGKEASVYFDRYVTHCLFETLANCVHAPNDISNPWLSSAEEPSGLKATMWWRLKLDGRFLEVEFINACDKKEVILSPTEARAGLERVGGELITYVVDGGNDRIAVGDTYQESRPVHSIILDGLAPDQRAAITLVRIPLTSTVQER